jgi:hypothetical protein
LNVNGVNDVMQTEVHTAEPLVPKPIAYENELTIEKLKSHKSPDTDQIPAELIKAGGRFAVSFINLLFLFGIRSNYPRTGRILS